MMHGFRHLPLIAMVAVGILSGNCRAGRPTELNIESRVEIYDYASDSLNAIELNPILFASSPLPFIKFAVGAIESYQSGCGQFDFWGVSVINNQGDLKVNFETNEELVVGPPGVVGGWALDNFTFNGFKGSVEAAVIPTVTPCGPTSVQTKMGGESSLYIGHIGTGPYSRKVNSGNFRSRRDLEIINNSDETIVLPLSVAGSVTTAVSLAPDRTTFARGSLRISGNVGGFSFNETITSENGLPGGNSVSVTKLMPVCQPKSRATFQYDVTGDFSVDVSAKGIGFWGLIMQSATASVDFPDAFSVQQFRGESSAGLPPNVIIRAPVKNGAVYADTTMSVDVVSVADSSVVLGLHGAPDYFYRIQRSDDLKSWETVGTSVQLSDPYDLVTLFRVPGKKREFFRMVYP